MATPLEEAFVLLKNAHSDEIRIVQLPSGSTRIEIIPQIKTTVPRQVQRPPRLPTITPAERRRLLDSLPEDQGGEDSEVWVQWRSWMERSWRSVIQVFPIHHKLLAAER